MSTNLPLTEYAREEEILRSQGIKANRHRSFQIEFTGKQIYDLLHILERDAVDSHDYLQVSAKVIFAEIIREQAKGQGF